MDIEQKRTTLTPTHCRSLIERVLEPQRVLELHSYFKLHLYIKLTSFDTKANAEMDSAHRIITMASARKPMPLIFLDDRKGQGLK